MKVRTKGWLAALVTLVSTGSLLAHHSLGNFATTKAVRVKGAIVQFSPPATFPHKTLCRTNRLSAASGGLYPSYPSEERAKELDFGRIVRISGLAEVTALCLRIAHDLRNQYTLGYSPKNMNNDGTWGSKA